MFFYTVLCLVLQTSLCNGGTEKMAITTTAPRLDRNIYKKTAELLHNINDIHDESGSKEQSDQGVSMDYFSMRHSREMALKQVMHLIQKNYDASKKHENLPKVRLHFISNPQVLEQFKAIIKQNDKSINEDYSDDPNSKLKELLMNLRRQAVFRIDEPTSVEKAIPDNQPVVGAIQQSAEVKNPEVSKQDIIAEVGDSRKKDAESKEKDAWDAITKNYDWDAKDKTDWGGKDISDEDKKKTDKKDKWDDWDTKDKKDKFDDEGQDKKKDIWDDWGQDKDKKDKYDVKDKKDDWGQKKNKKKLVNVEKIDEWGQNNDVKNMWDDKKKKKDTWDDWAQKKDTLDTWDPPKQKKEKIDIKWNESNKRKDYDSKKKKEKRDDLNSWDNWEMTTKQKRKTTKRNSQITFKKINEWEHYVPKVQSKPKRQYERNIPAGAFGRTSIPFVGKKGIYEDK